MVVGTGFVGAAEVLRYVLLTTHLACKLWVWVLSEENLAFSSVEVQ